MLLEWCNGWEQSIWASVWCHCDHPHTHNSRYPHHPLGLHQNYTHRAHRLPTVRFCSQAGGYYVGPPATTSNTLHNIQTDTALTNLSGPPTQTTMTLGWGEERAHRSDTSHSPIIERILAEVGAYYTRELVFSRRQQWNVARYIIHKCVLYARFHGTFFVW